jgi:hypothetical protein
MLENDPSLSSLAKYVLEQWSYYNLNYLNSHSPPL